MAEEVTKASVLFANELGQPLEQVREYNKNTGEILSNSTDESEKKTVGQKRLEEAKELKRKQDEQKIEDKNENKKEEKKEEKSGPEEVTKPSVTFANELGQPLTQVREYEKNTIDDSTKKTRKSKKDIGRKRLAEAIELKKEEEKRAQFNKTKKNRLLPLNKTLDLEEIDIDVDANVDANVDEPDNQSVTSNNFEPNSLTDDEEPAPPSQTQASELLLESDEHHILRIGEDSSSEYIELGNMPFKEKNTNEYFAALEIGTGIRDLANLYNARGEKAIRAMMKAFAVPRIGAQAPIFKFIELKCKFEGIDLVRDALNYRVKTLKQGISMKAGTEKAKLDTHRLEFVQKILKILPELTNPCPMDLDFKLPTESTSLAGCPCLEELSLLRDLIFLVLILQGNADSHTKEQLATIPLNKVLALAEKNNISNAKLVIRQALQKLKDIIKKENTTAKNTSTPILQEIFKALKPSDEPPKDLTISTILNMIENLRKDLQDKLDIINGYRKSEEEISRLRDELELANQKIADLTQQLSTKASEVASTQRARAISNSQNTQTESDVEDIGIQVENTATKLQLDQLLAQKAELEKKLLEGTTNLNTQRKDADTARELLQQQLISSRNEIEKLKRNIQNLEDKIAPLEETARQIDSVTQNLSETSRLLEDARKKLQACESNSEDQKLKYDVEIEDLKKKLATAKVVKEGLHRQLEEETEKGGSEITKLGAELTTAKETIQRLENEIEAKGSSQTQAEKLYEENKTELLEKINSLEQELESLRDQIPKERLSAAEEEKRKCDEELLKKEEEISNIRKQLEEAQEATEKAKTNSQTELSAFSTNKDAELEAKNSQIKELQIQLSKLEEELQQAKDAQQNAITELANLHAQKSSNLLAKDTEISSLQTELETQQETINQLRTELEARSQQETISTEKNIQIARLEQQHKENTEKITALEASLAAVESTIPAIEKEKDKAITNITTDLKEAREELDKKNAEFEEASKKQSAEIEELKSQLAEIESQLPDKDKEITAKNLEILQLKNQLSTIRAEKRQANEQSASKKEALESEIQRLKDEITAKEAELSATEKQKNEIINTIGDLQAKIDKMTAEATEKSAEQEREILELKQTITSLENELAQASERLSKAPQKADLQEAQARIVELEEKLAQLSEEMETTIQSEKDETKKRLDNLLSKVLIDDTLAEKVQQYISGEINDLSFEDDLQEELCEFFRYLVGLINLQLTKISASKLPDQAGKDIFTIFENMPPVENPNALLIEISNIFQELFVGVGKTQTIPRELELSKDYPILYSLLGNFSIDKSGNPLKQKDPGWASRIMTDIGSVSYMITTGIQPDEEKDKIIVRQSKSREEFQSNNQDHFVPLSILAIKLIQLLAQTLTGKYKNLAKRCGIPLEPVAGFAKIQPVEPVSQDTTGEQNNKINLDQKEIASKKAKEAVEKLRQKGKQYTKSSLLGDINRYINLLEKSIDSSPSEYDTEYNKRHLQELLQLFKERQESDPRTYQELPKDLERRASNISEIDI